MQLPQRQNRPKQPGLRHLGNASCEHNVLVFHKLISFSWPSGFSLLSCHSRPFTRVQNGNWREVMRKVGCRLGTTDCADDADERPLKSIRRLGRLAKDNWPNPRQPKTRRRSDAATANRRLRSIAPTCFPFLSARGRLRFFRSTDRLGADPTTASV